MLPRQVKRLPAFLQKNTSQYDPFWSLPTPFTASPEQWHPQNRAAQFFLWKRSAPSGDQGALAMPRISARLWVLVPTGEGGQVGELAARLGHWHERQRKAAVVATGLGARVAALDDPKQRSHSGS